MDSCMRAYATVQQLLCHRSYCELILSLARTSCRLSFSLALLPPALLPAIRQPTMFAKNPSKSTLVHDAVAAAVLHKHHPIIRIGAGLIQFVYGSHLRLATEVTSSKILFPLFFCANFIRLRQTTESKYPLFLINRQLKQFVGIITMNAVHHTKFEHA